MSIMRFSPSDAKDNIAYASLYSYLNAKQRYAIVRLESMEVYVVPLASYQPIPAKLHPLGGPGLPESHTNLLLAVILPKQKLSDNLTSSQPGTSRKRKSVTFDDYVKRKYTSMPRPHRALNPGPRRTVPTQRLYQSSPSSSHDSWDSPRRTVWAQPSAHPAPDYLDTMIQELERDEREAQGVGFLGGEPPGSTMYSPFVHQEACLVSEAGGQEAFRSGLGNVLQFLSHNIHLMSDPCAVPTEAAAGNQNLGGIPLVSAGAPVSCSWGPQGVLPLYTVLPEQCSSMGPTANGLVVPQLPTVYYQASSASPVSVPPCVPIQVTSPLYYQPSETAAGASQYGAVNEVQSVLQAILSLTSQVSHPQPECAVPFQPGNGLDVPAGPGAPCNAPAQQPDTFLPPPPSIFVPTYGYFTSSPGS